MGATPRYKVFNEQNEYIGSFKYAEDAAAFCIAGLGGHTVRDGHAKRDTVFTVGEEDSYDAAAHLIHSRIEKAWGNNA